MTTNSSNKNFPMKKTFALLLFMSIFKFCESSAQDVKYISIGENAKLKLEFVCSMSGTKCFTDVGNSERMLKLAVYPQGDKSFGKVVFISCKNQTYKIPPNAFEKPKQGTLFETMVIKACSLQ